MQIRPFTPDDLSGVMRIWNKSVAAGEVVYKPLTEAYFADKFLGNSGYFPELSLVAEQDGQVVGYINGTMKREFLPKETHENTPGYLTVIFVGQAHRRQGIGSALLSALLDAMKAAGKSAVMCIESNPLQLDWIVPGTAGHDHNKAPGMDVDCPGYAFLLAKRFTDVHREVAMYLDLADYAESPKIPELREKLLAEGIYTGRYDVSLGYDFDRMCDRVGSEYWRKVLQDETAAADPRVILVATEGDHIVAFTGPVDKQESGRGWFTGICTDPEYERRGIATVLFNLLMQEFILEGATFSTLFTGDDNHAQRLYDRTGFRVVRRFAILRKDL